MIVLNMREENTYLPAEVTLPKVDFDSKLTNLIIDLEKLRHRKLAGTTPESVYSEIKTVFQFLESIGSARIEGNRTTVSEFVEKIIDRTAETSLDEKTKEIYNIDSAINFINDIVKEGTKIDKALIFEIHKKIVLETVNHKSKFLISLALFLSKVILEFVYCVNETKSISYYIIN